MIANLIRASVGLHRMTPMAFFRFSSGEGAGAGA
jgi:hypothetical protein